MKQINPPRTGGWGAAPKPDPVPAGMRRVERPSAVPLYLAAAVWVLWGLFLPIYQASHFLAVIALSVAAGLLGKKFCRPSYRLEPIPKEPLRASGNPELDQFRLQGEDALRQLAVIQTGIIDTAVRGKVCQLQELTQQIFAQVSEHPEQLPRVRKFCRYYLPTVLKLLATYEANDERAALSPNLTQTLRKIEGTLDTAIAAFQKQLDSLFDDQALDIATDITVLEGMLAQEGLTGSDFTNNTDHNQ